jgi:hypothetical protein
MNCANHPEQAAVAFCRTCGKPLCEICQKPAHGTIFCEEHYVPQTTGATPYPPYNATPGASPYTAPGATPYNYGQNPYIGQNISPGLAFLLGLIPGVGAIYNGQYAKGVIHVVILGFLISVLSSGATGGLEPLFGFLIPLWFFYMAFEAYHTAAKRLRGEQVDEFSSLFPMQPGGRKGFPVGPVLLIAFGVVFLLNTLEIVRMYQIVRYWPVFLIALGLYMLYARMSGGSDDSAASTPPIPTEAGHEQ